MGVSEVRANDTSRTLTGHLPDHFWAYHRPGSHASVGSLARSNSGVVALSSGTKKLSDGRRPSGFAPVGGRSGASSGGSAAALAGGGQGGQATRRLDFAGEGGEGGGGGGIQGSGSAEMDTLRFARPATNGRTPNN